MMNIPVNNAPRPDTPSADYLKMSPYWNMVSSILGGVKTMRNAGEAYLPKFELESTEEYEVRKKNARFTNVFGDIVENLAQRPFSKQVDLADGAPQPLKDFAEDVDGKGNSLHTFAGDTFYDGITNGIDYILVEYTKTDPKEVKTISDEKKAGVRPYWTHYPADTVLAAYSAQVKGQEEFIHVRFKETKLIRQGFKEVRKNRVRILNREELPNGDYAPATYEVWEEQEKKSGHDGAPQWGLIEGPKPLTIGIIPLVPFLTGRREGGWAVKPPMRDAADLQIELYQQENGLKNVKNLTAFPMLSGNGIDAELGEDGEPKPLAVGPRTVLYGGAAADGVSAGSWTFVEPGAASLKFLSEDIKDTIKELRELGRQPLTAQSGNLTVVTTAFAAQKGNSAIQAWALNLKDALQRAFLYTAMWLKLAETKVEVLVHTDFDIGLGDDKSFSEIVGMYAEGIISRLQLIHEAKRRGVIDKDYDPEADLKEILKQMEDEGDDETTPTARNPDDGDKGNNESDDSK